jgi:serine/threonine-protein kinase
MGAVYKALHLAFDELRALKVMTPELLSDQLFVRRFKHEAVITRKLQHPNAVRVDDIDESEDGRPFIVMEFIQGKSLKKIIQEEGPLPAPRVCSIIKQAAAALDAAHGLGMVHRDIKPDNIALVEMAEGERVKVLDFGIAKIKEARLGEGQGMTLTGTGVVIGTPQYMSPEQAGGKRGDELDGRSDLYSLGIVMYEMLTADLPFKADTTIGMLLAHMQTPPRPIRTLHPELQVPEPIANLTMKLLEKNPELRPASAQALIQEIEGWEKGLAPVVAPQVLPPTRVVSAEQVEAVQAAMRARPAAGEAVVGTEGSLPIPSAPAELRPAGPAAPLPAPSEKPAIAPPAKASRWGLWAAIGILAMVVGGGGWYLTTRRTAPVSPTPASVTPGPSQPQKAVETQNPSQTQPPAPSSPVAGQTPVSAKPEAPSASLSSQPSAAGSTTASPQVSPTVKRSEPEPQNKGAKVTQPGKTAAAPSAETQRRIKAALTLGNVYFGDGKYDDAIRAYEDGLSLDRSNPELRDRLERAKKAKAAEQRVLQ